MKPNARGYKAGVFFAVAWLHRYSTSLRSLYRLTQLPALWNFPTVDLFSFERSHISMFYNNTPGDNRVSWND